MKAAICLASLAILAGVMANKPFAWDPDTVYSYTVRSRFAAGMLGLEGIAIDDTETIRALVELTWDVDIYNSNANEIFMNPRNFRAVIAEERIHPRDQPIGSKKQVAIPEKYKNLLEKVMLVKLDPQSGVPVSISVRADNELSIAEKNIKRSQVQSFILNPGTSKLIVKGNVNRDTNSVRASDKDDDSGFFYKVMEQGIHGECSTYYQVSQTGPFQSLFQLEAQDIPVQDDQENEIEDNSPESGEPRLRNPRFAGMQQQQQWQKQMQQHQQQWQRQQQQQNENEQNLNNAQQPWPQAFRAFCDDSDQIYTIQKTVNLTNCKNRPLISNMMPNELLNCRPGDNSCGSLWSHVVNTRFLACGQSREDFTIIEVNQEERFVYGLRTDENIDGFAIKNVTLQQKERTSSNSAASDMEKQGQKLYVILGLVFEFDLTLSQFRGRQRQQHWQQQQHQQSHQWQQASRNQPGSGSDSSDSDSSEGQESDGSSPFPYQHQLPPLEEPPLSSELVTVISSQQQLFQRALQLLQNAAHNIWDPKRPVAERETIALQSTLAKILRYMNKQQQIDLYRQAFDNNENDEELQYSVLSMLFDAMAASGTNPSLVALMDLIEKEKITDVKAAQLIMTFAHYARHPTKQFLQRFEQLIQNRRLQKNEDIRTTALLTLSTLYNQVCINARTKQSGYSYALYGPFCQVEDTENFANEAIKQLEQALDKKDKTLQKLGRTRTHEIGLQLQVLSNLGHPKLIQVVQQILDKYNDDQVKTKAIFALKQLIRSHEENVPAANPDQNQNQVDRVESDPVTDNLVERKVLPILVSVALDKSEHPTVRIAAIQMLTYCTYADITVWQQLAMSTWFSVSQEVHSFIHTTITNLADLDVAPTRLHNRMIVKARAVAPLLKPLVDANAARSSNTFGSGGVHHLNTQFFRQFSWVGSRDSALPSSIYFRNFLVFGSGGAGVNPIEVAVQFRSLQKVIEKFTVKHITSSSSEESGEANLYMKQLLDDVLIRKMTNVSHGSVYVNLRNGMERLWQLENLEDYFNWKSLSNYESLRQGLPLNYQKTIQLAHQSMEFPSIFGVPLSFKLRAPAMISIRGKARLNAGRGDVQFQTQLDLVAGYKRHAKIALKLPYIQRKIESGIQTHLVAQIPFRLTARRRSDEPVVVAITPIPNINQTRATGKIDLVTFHRQPYVAVITDELYPTVHLLGGQMQVIRTEPATEINRQKNILGFVVSTHVDSDYRQEEQGPQAWSAHMSNFPDAETYANLGTYGGPVAKYVSRKVVLNVDESQSKTVIFLLAAKRGAGSLDDGLDTDISSSSSSSSSTSESDESNSSGTSEETNNRPTLRQRQEQQSQSSSASSSSSSSSSESNSASNSNENSKEVLQKSNLLVVAVLIKDKEVPPVARTASLVNLLDAEFPNQQQYILQLAKRTNKFYLRYAQGAAAEKAAQSLPSHSESVQMLANAIIQPNYQGQQKEFCSEITGKMTYPDIAHPKLLVALRQSLLKQDLKVQVQALAQFASTCKSEDLRQTEIKIAGELERGPNMTHWATIESQEARKCTADEKKGFSVSDDCLTCAVQQAAGLNRARVTVQWSENIPQVVQQVFYNARDVVKAVYQPYAYHNHFPANPTSGNSAIVKLQISPDSEYWSADILSNETELLIQNVPSNEFIQAALPLSAIQSVKQNIKDYIYGLDGQPTCQLEGKSISTFDNVVEDIDTNVAHGCNHLLTADGSGRDTMAVFVNRVGTDDLRLILVLPENQIELSSVRNVPRARRAQVAQAGDIVALVNGKPRQLPTTIRKRGQSPQSNDYVARIQIHPSGGVQILTPKNDYAFDGSKVIIFADDSYRNRTIGMCGDFDGERVADRRSRKDIPLSSATLLYANYAYQPQLLNNDEPDSGSCTVDQQTQDEIKAEEALAKIKRNNGNGPSKLRWINNQFTRGQQKRAWQNLPVVSSSSSSSSEEQNKKPRSGNRG